MHKKQVEADTIREFVEGRKVWAVKEKEASEEENRQIIKFIEKKDAWRREQEAIAKDRRYIIQCFCVFTHLLVIQKDCLTLKFVF